MNPEKIRSYDDQLVLNEKSTKSSLIVVNILTFIVIGFFIVFPFWRISKSPSDMELFGNMVSDITKSIGWLIVLLILRNLYASRLKHISSIKLYREN